VACVCGVRRACAACGVRVRPCLVGQGGISPPSDYDAWANLVTALVNNFINRYGIGEVRLWKFEVWNEVRQKSWRKLRAAAQHTVVPSGPPSRGCCVLHCTVPVGW
jgi:hypothetical protein